MTPAKLKDFFKVAHFFYDSVGMQPYKESDVFKTKTVLSNYIFYAELINLNLYSLFQVMFVVKAFWNGNNFVEAVTVMSYIGFVVVSNTKVLFISLKKPTLTRVVNGFKEIFPPSIKSQTHYRLSMYLRKCSRISIGFSALYMILLCTYILMGIAKHVICDLLMGMTGIEQELPYIIYIPWDWHQHWSYYLIYAGQSMAAYTAIAGQISSDLFLIACTSQLVMHFDYVSRELTCYQVAKEVEGVIGADAKKKNMDFLKQMTRYHNNLLHLSEQLNEVFGVPLLLNFISSSCVICFVAFQITIGASPETMVKLCLFIFSSSAEIYLICHYGQQLLDASTNVASAVYNQEWICSDIRYQKMLILIAKRAQKPVQLKATTFVLVSHGTMTQIMQVSYKFFALLRTMYAK